MNAAEIRFIDVLKKHRQSITKSRMLIFKTLSENGLMTMQNLILKCPEVDRASIYRAIAVLEEIEIVHKVTHGFKYHIELSDLFVAHHHHITCEKCLSMSEIVTEDIEKVIQRAAKSNGFTLTRPTVELRGICGTCKMPPDSVEVASA